MKYKMHSQRLAILILSLISAVFGIALMTSWSRVYQNIMFHELSLENNNTKQYIMWKETPIPMYLNVYLFNFTNYEQVLMKNWAVKPHFDQCGPYVFREHHIRENITFNSNGTITFRTKRIWRYLPQQSNGTLYDEITNINLIVATVAYFVRNKHFLVHKVIDMLLRRENTSLVVTKPARELLFDGYDDPLLDLIHKLHLPDIQVPFNKFGWFVERNGSAAYDGWFTMHTGADDLNSLGRLTLWNGANTTRMYPGSCGAVNGTTGELWYPVKNDSTVSVFASDLCSSVQLERNGSFTKYGVNGNLYIGTEQMFDNGTKYPEMLCYSSGGKSVVSGVRNISQCKFGAPAFVSYPHFRLADPTLRHSISGMMPNQSQHEFYISLDPITGIPLRIQAALQINVLLVNIKTIKLFAHVPPLFMPMLWFQQSAELSEELSQSDKILLLLPNIGYYTACCIAVLSVFVLCIISYVIYRNGWIITQDELLLSKNSLAT